jgi:DNA-binding MarR family transcriptional regulator
MSIFRELGIKDGKDRLNEELLYNLGYCYVVLEKKIAEILSPFGLSPIKMNALLIIKHVGKDKGLSQSDLSKKMIVTAGNITGLIDRLEKERLVERSSLKNDRRVKILKITSKGSNLLEKVWPLYKRTVDQIISSIPGIDIVSTTVGLSGLRETTEGSKY